MVFERSVPPRKKMRFLEQRWFNVFDSRFDYRVCSNPQTQFQNRHVVRAHTHTPILVWIWRLIKSKKHQSELLSASNLEKSRDTTATNNQIDKLHLSPKNTLAPRCYQEHWHKWFPQKRLIPKIINNPITIPMAKDNNFALPNYLDLCYSNLGDDFL